MVAGQTVPRKKLLAAKAHEHDLHYRHRSWGYRQAAGISAHARGSNVIRPACICRSDAAINRYTNMLTDILAAFHHVFFCRENSNRSESFVFRLFSRKIVLPPTEIHITGRYLGLLYYWFVIGTRINSPMWLPRRTYWGGGKKFVPWQLQNGGQAEPE